MPYGYEACVRAGVEPSICAVEVRLDWLSRLLYGNTKDSVRLKHYRKLIRRANRWRAPGLPDPEEEAKALLSNRRKEARVLEEEALKWMRRHPVYTTYLRNLIGIGTKICIMLLGRVPAWRFPNISKGWKYLTLWRDPDEKLYRRNQVKPVLYLSLWQNVRLDGYYTKIYQHYRERLSAKGYTGAKLHFASLHRTAKRFWQHYWLVYRATMNLPLTLPYETARGIEVPPPPGIDMPKTVAPYLPECTRTECRIVREALLKAWNA